METEKARQRRLQEGFFEKYIHGCGVDVGCGADVVIPDAIQWDKPLDAHSLYKPSGEGIASASLDFTYSSHCLEDLENPWAAIREWWRVIRPGGHLAILVPHRNLFECRKTLPSAGNKNHRWFFLLDRNEEPVTLGLVPLVASVCPDSELIYAKTCDEGYSVRFQPFKDNPAVIQVIANGEFSIEAVWKKRDITRETFVEDMILPEMMEATK